MTEYNFYGRLRLIIDSGGHRGYERYFNNEYLRISCGSNGDRGLPTIRVNIVEELPDKRPGLRRIVHVKKLFTFRYLVESAEGKDTIVHFQTHYLDKLYMNAIAVFLQAQVIEPLMYLKLMQEGVLLMHAAGVSRDGQGYIFPAFGGTGKTSFSIALLRHGFKLLGDDLLLVDTASGCVYPYARPLHLFTYNIRNLHGARVPMKYQAAIYSKNILRFALERVLKTEFLISTRVHADELFFGSPYGRPSPCQSMAVLVKEGDQITSVKVTESNRLMLARRIIDTADLNRSLYSILDEEDAVANVRMLEEDLVQSLLEHFDEVSFINTRKLDLTDLHAFICKYFHQGV